ncbi:hypothetical protein PHAVU_007G237100 [Phaseolus vulgaris]|uniref:Invertebrate defensins family profile domain-containing protein n=1 Tax=Phaseolus vulgaris TaxID=3885 RepID=V7BHN5_PHAVU|nr:hypothetical protein PHAVU_007G237100g [Phaseolus vulgaris]ESW17409.1 hypothetical protein PHAVU_007G237100g [Phaseolus vulgaris]
MSAYSQIWIVLFKVLLLATIVVVISSGVGSQHVPPNCHGTCGQFPDCDAHCKVIGYVGGKCSGTLCCCS